MSRLQRYATLIVAVLGCSGFGIFALLLTQGFAPMLRLDANLAEDCYEYTASHPSIREVFTVITDTGTGRPLWIVGLASLAALILYREWGMAVIWAVGQYVVKYIPELLKSQFNRPRPPYLDYPGTSFPSGHATASAAIYGMLLFLVLHLWAGSRWRWLIAGLLLLHIVLIDLSRMLLSAHYLSDVLAGTCIGLAWAALCASAARPLQRTPTHTT